MRKRGIGIAFTALLLCLCTTGWGKGPVRLRYGLDWGYSPMLYKASTATYCTQVGYRVTESTQGFDYYTNAYLTLGAGVEFRGHCAIYLKTGYMGLYKDYRVNPILAEFRYFFRDCTLEDGAFLCMEGGVALHKLNFEDKTSLGNLGFGFRHILSSHTSLDFVAKAGLSVCSPLPNDRYEGVIARDKVIFSKSEQLSLSLGLSLYF